MPETKYFYTNGSELKSFDLTQYPDAAWDFITGAPDTKDNELYASVAAVFRVANMTADACASLPFAVVSPDGSDYDTSQDWQNKVGFLRAPRELIRLWRLSLFMTNKAYGFMEGNRVIRNLRYILPSSITPIKNTSQGLMGFTRKIGTQTIDYSLKDNRIFYMWRLDHTTELLPSEYTEFRALMAAAGCLFYADYYVNNFFQRGGIKPTMLMVKGVPTPQEREKIEKLWDKVMRGFSKYLGKIFNADSIEPIQIGEGIENLKDSALHDEKLADIAMACGMPLSLLLSNSANYATAKTEKATWFQNSIIPWANFMGDEISSQLFEPLGLKFEFRPEASEQGQEEEVARSAAYLNYLNAYMMPSVAVPTLGIDLPDNVTLAKLDADYLALRSIPANNQQQPIPSEPDEVEEAKSTTLSIDQLRELELWQQFAFRKLKQGKSLDFPFVCKCVPESLASEIRDRLPACKTEQDIAEAFEMTPREDGELIELASAMNRLADKIEKGSDE
jgi:hypothetical protein